MILENNSHCNDDIRMKKSVLTNERHALYLRITEIFKNCDDTENRIDFKAIMKKLIIH